MARIPVGNKEEKKPKKPIELTIHKGVGAMRKTIPASVAKTFGAHLKELPDYYSRLEKMEAQPMYSKK